MKQTKAFTLIEIVTVAIIAGALALMALPSLTKMLSRSYGTDALHNLMTIYAAQQNYQQSSGSYCTGSCDTTAHVSDNLGVNFISSGGLGYYCSGDNTCSATVAGGSAGTFTMKVDLTKPINVTTNPVYCNSLSAPDFTVSNPCCTSGTGGAVNANCP